MAAIVVDQLKKYYGKVKAVDGLSFEVNEGEIFGFLGPNGAGKTTTIRCMMDFVHPYSGSVKILGLDSQKDASRLKGEVGYLAPEPRIYPNWTGWDHINFVKSVEGGKSNEGDLIKRFKFDPTKKAKSLSSGNKQKLGLILSMMNDHRVFILDEPTTGLDPMLQNRVYETLQETVSRGGTVFLSSHNLAEVERICDRVGVIKDGKLIATETISNLKSKQMYRITAYFGNGYKIQDFQRDDIKIIKKMSNGLVMDVKGDINGIIDFLQSQKLTDLEVSRSSLEEIFMEYYV